MLAAIGTHEGSWPAWDRLGLPSNGPSSSTRHDHRSIPERSRSEPTRRSSDHDVDESPPTLCFEQTFDQGERKPSRSSRTRVNCQPLPPFPAHRTPRDHNRTPEESRSAHVDPSTRASTRKLARAPARAKSGEVPFGRRPPSRTLNRPHLFDQIRTSVLYNGITSIPEEGRSQYRADYRSRVAGASRRLPDRSLRYQRESATPKVYPSGSPGNAFIRGPAKLKRRHSAESNTRQQSSITATRQAGSACGPPGLELSDLRNQRTVRDEKAAPSSIQGVRSGADSGQKYGGHIPLEPPAGPISTGHVPAAAISSASW